eukprot:1690367-Karenia_brevis.AAC.1
MAALKLIECYPSLGGPYGIGAQHVERVRVPQNSLVANLSPLHSTQETGFASAEPNHMHPRPHPSDHLKAPQERAVWCGQLWQRAHIVLQQSN